MSTKDKTFKIDNRGPHGMVIHAPDGGVYRMEWYRDRVRIRAETVNGSMATGIMVEPDVSNAIFVTARAES